MGVCTACSSEVADEQLNDELCPNCSDTPVEAPIEEVVAPANATVEEAPAEEAAPVE